MEYLEFRAMNSDVVFAAEGDSRLVRHGFKRAREFVQTSEARLTRFSDASELARLNRSSGQWFHASPDLYAIVKHARSLVAGTDGLFNPAILDALERAGYDISMDQIRSQGARPPQPALVMPPLDFRQVELDDLNSGIRLPEGLRIDLGGIAKSWIAEQAAQYLAEFADACAVNAGGDMFLIGQPRDEPAWFVELQDPRDENKVLALLRVQSGAVTTSSITRRQWRQNGHMQHHLIDPRTGRPAETDWLSVTVIAPHAADAEVFAKALLIAGSRGADRILAKRDGLAYLAVDRAGQMWGSSSVREYMNGTVQNV